MKPKDIGVIVAVVIVSGVISFFISSKIFVSSSDKQQTVVTVDSITSDFVQPSSRYFNADSVDPSQLVQIGNNNNTAPFNNGQ